MTHRCILCVFLLFGPAAVLPQQTPKILAATGKVAPAGLLDAGSLTCVGGQPTGRPLQCSPGTTKTLLWNYVGTQAFQDVAGTAAAMFRGQNTVVMHCNLDQNSYGYCWGTFEWDAPEMGGKWQGVWSGPWDMSINVTAFHMTGYGTGGQVEGLRLEFDSVYPGGAQTGTFVAKVFR